MFEKRSTMELCSLISLLLVLFCIVNVRSVQLVKLSGGSGKSAWSKSASSQPFRHIRGFRPESLSTARGFGKRAGGLPLEPANFYYPNNPNTLTSLTNLIERLNQYNKENLNLNGEPKDFLLYRDDAGSRYPWNGKQRVTFDSEENSVRKGGLNDDEISNNY